MKKDVFFNNYLIQFSTKHFESKHIRYTFLPLKIVIMYLGSFGMKMVILKLFLFIFHDIFSKESLQKLNLARYYYFFSH